MIKNNIMESVYTFRGFQCVVKYDVIECSEDQKTLIAKDTSCSDHDNCIIELVKDDDSYVLSKLINESAKKHSFLHEDCRYYESKEYVFLKILENEIKYLENDIKKRTFEIEEIAVKLLNKNLPVKYLTPENWEYNKIFYTLDYGRFEIIGKVEYKDGKYGYVVDWKDEYYDYDAECDDRPEILTIIDDKIAFNMYNVCYVFYDENSFNNYHKNIKNESLKKLIKVLQTRKTELENKINIIKDIIDKYNKEHISYNVMLKLYNSIWYGKR